MVDPEVINTNTDTDTNTELIVEIDQQAEDMANSGLFPTPSGPDSLVTSGARALRFCCTKKTSQYCLTINYHHRIR